MVNIFCNKFIMIISYETFYSDWHFWGFWENFYLAYLSLRRAELELACFWAKQRCPLPPEHLFNKMIRNHYRWYLKYWVQSNRFILVGFFGSLLWKCKFLKKKASFKALQMTFITLQLNIIRKIYKIILFVFFLLALRFSIDELRAMSEFSS